MDTTDTMARETMARDIALLCSGDLGATLPELRMAYSLGETMQMALTLGE